MTHEFKESVYHFVFALSTHMQVGVVHLQGAETLDRLMFLSISSPFYSHQVTSLLVGS
jgi:hypothetical protein